MTTAEREELCRRRRENILYGCGRDSGPDFSKHNTTLPFVNAHAVSLLMSSPSCTLFVIVVSPDPVIGGASSSTDAKTNSAAPTINPLETTNAQNRGHIGALRNSKTQSTATSMSERATRAWLSDPNDSNIAGIDLPSETARRTYLFFRT